jgi:transaldolase
LTNSSFVPYNLPSLKILNELKIKIWADGADAAGMVVLNRKPFIKGFTTNPTLMRKAGITDYEVFAGEILGAIQDKPVSFEVFSDDFNEMERQALKIKSWGKNVYVKIPITNTLGESSVELIRSLSAQGVKLNVTAMLTAGQIRSVVEVLNSKVPAVVSLFAGRIADTGRDPCVIAKEVVKFLEGKPNIELLWASCRELLNIFQADQCGCHIITVTHDILAKIPLIGMDLEKLSLETVKMFHRDAEAAEFRL